MKIFEDKICFRETKARKKIKVREIIIENKLEFSPMVDCMESYHWDGGLGQ